MIKVEIGFGVEFRGDGSPIFHDELAFALNDIKHEAMRLFGGFTIYQTSGGWIDPDTKAEVLEVGRCLVIYVPTYSAGQAAIVAQMCLFIKVRLWQKTVALCVTEVESKIV